MIFEMKGPNLFILTLFLSACATAPQTVTPKSSKTLLVKEIPNWVLEPCYSGDRQIAEVGAPWDRTCVKKSLPRTHLVSACESKGIWKVVCEEGGYSVKNKSITAQILPGGRFRVDYILSLENPEPLHCD